MYLIETSAWIEYLRQTGSTAHKLVHDLVVQGDHGVTEPVIMELFAGETNERRREHLANLLQSGEILQVDAALDYEEAARLFRVVRRNGRTVRSLVDCLIAAVALRTGATLVHNDVDYDVIADCVTLDALRPGPR